MGDLAAGNDAKHVPPRERATQPPVTDARWASPRPVADDSETHTMVEDICLWRAARAMVERYGHEAPQRARAHAASASHDGDADGARIWRAVARAAEWMLYRNPRC